MNSVSLLGQLTDEVTEIRKSLESVSRQPVEQSPLLGRKAPSLPAIPGGRSDGRPLRGLAGVVAARNKRDAEKMKSVVELVQRTLGSMEDRLERRLGQLEHRVGEVGASYAESFDLPGVAPGGGGGGSDGAARPGARSTSAAGAGAGDANTKIKRMDDALKLYQVRESLHSTSASWCRIPKEAWTVVGCCPTAVCCCRLRATSGRSTRWC